MNSDWLWAGQLRGRSSSPGRVKNCNFSISSGLALGTGASFCGDKAAGVVELTTRLQLVLRSRERGFPYELVTLDIKFKFDKSLSH
jgi:hypothetical protein